MYGHRGHLGQVISPVSIKIWVPLSHEVCPVAPGQKLFESNEIWVTLTSGICISPRSHLVYNVYQLHIIDFNSFWIIHHLCSFPYKCIRNLNWPLHTKVKDQPKIIIWRNLVVFWYPMLHTKSQDHRLFGSREGFYHIWERWPSRLCDHDHLKKHLFLQCIEAPHKIWLQLAHLLLRRRCLKCWWTTDTYLYYKLTNEPWAQVS